MELRKNVSLVPGKTQEPRANRDRKGGDKINFLQLSKFLGK